MNFTVQLTMTWQHLNAKLFPIVETTSSGLPAYRLTPVRCKFWTNQKTADLAENQCCDVIGWKKCRRTQLSLHQRTTVHRKAGRNLDGILPYTKQLSFFGSRVKTNYEIGYRVFIFVVVFISFYYIRKEKSSFIWGQWYDRIGSFGSTDQNGCLSYHYG